MWIYLLYDDCRISIKIKRENFHKIVIRLAMVYGVECWWISENTRKDRIGNEEIRIRIGLSKKMGGSRLRWFGYVQRRVISALVKKSVDLSWGNKIGRGREIKMKLKDVVKKWHVN